MSLLLDRTVLHMFPIDNLQSDNKIVLSEIQAEYKDSFYKAKITEKDYKPEIVKIAVKKVNYKSQDT